MTPGDVHINRPLTNISVSWAQDRSAFVSDRIFPVIPVIPVMKQSDAYYEYDLDVSSSNPVQSEGR